MSFFIDKHGRRKSPIALAACGAALLDLAVYFCTAALLAGPLYRTVSFGGETVTSMLHTTIITVISTLLCWAGCDPADVLRGGVDAAAGDERLYAAPVSDGRPAAGAAWQRRQLAHLPKAAKGASRVFRQKDHLGGAEQEQKKKPAAKPVSDPVQTPEPDISPTEALFGPESSGTAPGAFHNAQDEAMLFYEDDDDES